MRRAKLEIDTEAIKVNGEIHCAYCGKKIEPDTEIDHGDTYDYHHCDCEDARLEIQLKNDIKFLDADYKRRRFELENRLPKRKYKVEKTEIATLI